MRNVMKPASCGWIVYVSIAIGACTAPTPSRTGSSSPASGTSSAVSAEAPAAAPATGANAASVKSAVRPDVELAAGTVVTVRTTRALSTVRDRAQDTFNATLDEPVIVNDVEVLPRGTRLTGHVTSSQDSGHLEGRAVLGITLDAFELKGERYSIATSVNTRASEGHKKRNVTAIGGGAGVGALIGGIAGGGKGAAIGAGIGAGAGTGAAAATGKQHVEIPAETRFRFTLKNGVTLAS